MTNNPDPFTSEEIRAAEEAVCAQARIVTEAARRLDVPVPALTADVIVDAIETAECGSDRIRAYFKALRRQRYE